MALIIPDQATKADSPGKGSFNHPAPWQQDKTLLGFAQLDETSSTSLAAAASAAFWPS